MPAKRAKTQKTAKTSTITREKTMTKPTPDTPPVTPTPATPPPSQDAPPTPPSVAPAPQATPSPEPIIISQPPTPPSPSEAPTTNQAAAAPPTPPTSPTLPNTPTPSPTTTPITPPQPSSGKKLIITVIAGLLALLGLGGGAYYLITSTNLSSQLPFLEQTPATPSVISPQAPTTEEETASYPTPPPLSNSDTVEDLESDLEATDLSTLDSDLHLLDQELQNL